MSPLLTLLVLPTLEPWSRARLLTMAEIQANQKLTTAFVGGGVIGSLGGLMGLAGAEFRLPLLVGIFRSRRSKQSS